MNSLFQTFSILDHIDKLTPAKEKGRYICPVCEGNNLTVSKNGAYQCWNGCECREIREAIAPLHLDRTVRLSPARPVKRLKAKPKPAIAIPPTESIFLAMLPSPADDSPLPQKRFDPKHGEITETVYQYSQTQWVVRTQWADASREKGYSKTFSQWHLARSGETIQVWENGQKVTREAQGGESIPTKGSIPWQAYRIDEALAAVTNQSRD
ncbi:hypothetical protein H6G17_31605 [Chroococcidiopsis sp. FACHB-1243]|uniref:hypothetical protein n=1 Tax=Chroococcidiopsis sp. [FACHB-1243] TaxID=2692781 RepID=UPI00177C71A2|nr:hypothetical protein [Chroococcidiopsis sp. [FACHB-1243]]MBD2309949.1 hypothetical protein [Chroococcidiopsis sp. [FACHB-1243]]